MTAKYILIMMGAALSPGPTIPELLQQLTTLLEKAGYFALGVATAHAIHKLAERLLARLKEYQLNRKG